ncbi:MAG: tetratricopeptide repeat protein [Gomphosphaeria aponina SAG 52.96 = DSM 107014]|uniref:Tetratricopeptide repeat protein n=1 Tax=Gomphosphaeria aponina SAG 52.96 = DSM 107014 TaxID=1521640 RepID=A0A941GTQ0_9CHRO|nr:tetratricopeptide repeat protein [Gomphosphaeria aponina SAG 52.96 = DSM 107014]
MLTSNQHSDFWQTIRNVIKTQHQAPLLKPAPKNTNLPLSFGQERLWELIKIQPETLLYNINNSRYFNYALEVSALEKSLREIVRRHSILRTTFPERDGQPGQNILSETSFKLPVIDLQQLPPAEQITQCQQIIKEEAQKPFNLREEPGFRVKLLCLGEAEYLLLLTFHHLIFDGFSSHIFTGELKTLYEAYSTNQSSPLPELPIQYADFAYWQKQWLASKTEEKLIKYWQEKLSGNLQPLQLPADNHQPVLNYEGATEYLTIAPQLTQSLKYLTQQEGVTLFTTLLAAFKTLLYCYTGQEDLILVSPMAGRDRPETQKLIGYFNNLIVMRTNLEENPTFRELLQRVKKTVLEAKEHQDLPFQKEFTHIPLSRGMFTLQNYKHQPLTLTKITTKQNSEIPEQQKENSVKNRAAEIFASRDISPEKTANFDLALTMYDQGKKLTGKIKYKTDLFKATTITQMKENFLTLVAKLVHNPDIHIAELAEEWEQNLHPQVVQISIEQIEKLLGEHPNIEENTILVLEDSQGNKQLTAYIVPTQKEIPTLEGVRSFLQAKIPNYMIPESFVLLDSLPLKPNGKINYRSLAKLNQIKQKPPTTLPSTPVEKKLAEIWGRVLWLEQEIGIHDNFFDLGGHSLLAVKLVGEIEKEFNTKLPLTTLSQLSTISELVNFLKEVEPHPNPPRGFGRESGVPPEPAGGLGGVNSSELAPEIYHQLLAYTSGWRGKRVKPHSLIVGMNIKGTKQPLFWCFQGFKELYQLAKYMGENQPIYGMRSGHLAMEKTEENIKALGLLYVNEILEVNSTGPYLIGGNCQAGKIAFEMAIKLQELGKTVTLLCILDKSDPPRKYNGKVAFFFGRESWINPYKDYQSPELGWRKYYPGGFSIDLVSGTYGKMFDEPNIQTFADKLKSRLEEGIIATAAITTELEILPETAYSAQITVEKTLVGIAGETLNFQVKVKNNSPVTWQATEKSGITLGNYWLEGTGKTIQGVDGRVYLLADVPPEGEIPLELPITIPIEPGNYLMALDLVEEGVTWFRNKGSQITIVQVEVISSEAGKNPEKNAEFYRNLGDKQFGKGDAASAIVSYEKAISLNPEQPFKVYQNLGDALSQKEQYAAAITAYAVAIKIEENHGNIYYMLGKTQEGVGELEQAKVSYEKAIALQSNQIHFYEHLVEVSLQLNQKEAVKNACQQGLKLQPKNATLNVRLGQLYIEENNLEAAITCAKKAVEVQPDNADFLFLLGYAQSQQGELEEAISYYQKSIEIKPEAIGIYINWGRIISQQGNYEKALEIYEKALLYDTNHADLYRNIGEVLFKQQDVTGAIRNYEKVIELEPENFTNYQVLGDVLSYQGDFEQAIKLYHQAIKLNPKVAIIYYNLATAQLKTGDLAAAIKNYEKAKELEPNLEIEFNEFAS